MATKRISTRSLVRINQVWEERTRRKAKPTVTIKQVYRHDRQVRAQTETGEVVTINFGVLRKKYRPINPQGGPK